MHAAEAKRYWALLIAYRKCLAAGFATMSALIFILRFHSLIPFRKFEWSGIEAALRHSRPSLLMCSILGIYCCYAIRALRWMRFSRFVGATKFSTVFPSTLVGFTCSLMLGRAGEPVRPLLIAKKDSLSVPGTFAIYVVERLFDIAATMILAYIALRSVRVAPTDKWQPLLRIARSSSIGLFLVLLLGIGLLVAIRFKGPGMLNRRFAGNRWGAKISALLESFAAGLRIIHSWTDLAVAVAYSVVHWVLLIIVYLLVAHAFEGKMGHLTFSGATLVCAFTLIGSAIQVPGIGGGAQVASFLAFTVLLGVEKEAAAAASVVLWLVAFASCSLLGLPLLLREGWSFGAMKNPTVLETSLGPALAGKQGG
jgi:glycosyltransferase 2 family protein